MNEILEYVLIVLFVALYAFLLPLVIKKIDREKLSKIIDWAKIFVEAAEQIYESGEGSKKKNFVMDSLFDMFGFKEVDEYKIDAIVESQVNQLK